MTQAKLKKYLHSLECQKKDPQLLDADGQYCLRKLQEHLEELRELLQRVKDCDLIDKIESELMTEERTVSAAVDFYVKRKCHAIDMNAPFFGIE